MKFLRFLPLLLLLMIATACGEDNAADRLSRAEAAINDKEYELAQTLADSVISASNFDRLSATELCRTALVYSKLSELREPDANMASAALCMRAATGRNADSVEIFIGQLSVDDRAAIEMPRKLSHPIDIEDLPQEPLDSI